MLSEWVFRFCSNSFGLNWEIWHSCWPCFFSLIICSKGLISEMNIWFNSLKSSKAGSDWKRSTEASLIDFPKKNYVLFLSLKPIKTKFFFFFIFWGFQLKQFAVLCFHISNPPMHLTCRLDIMSPVKWLMSRWSGRRF